MLTNPDFLEIEARENGAVEVTVTVEHKSKHKLRLIVSRAEPSRDDDGKVIEGKLDHVVMEQDWDIKAGTVVWSHRMEELPNVRVSGTNRLLEAGSSSCQLIEEGVIAIKTGQPLFGWFLDWFIAGRVISGMKEERAKRATYLSGKAKASNAGADAGRGSGRSGARPR